MLSRTAAALAATARGTHRALASLPAVAADAESPLLRVASPAPAKVDLTPALVGQPETKVWGGARGEGGGQREAGREGTREAMRPPSCAPPCRTGAAPTRPTRPRPRTHRVCSF